MPDEQFKRNIAFKYKIGDILAGKPVFNGERFSFVELGDRKIIRVNIIGNIVDRYDMTGERKYTFLTIDDGSGQIRIKAFGDDAEKLEGITQGLTVVIIGLLRHFNNETYISPEIIKEVSPKYLLVRKLELEKNGGNADSFKASKKEEITAVKDRILDKIKQSESNGGIESDKIILELKDFSPEIINQEIKKLIEEGIIFEPRPGKLRWLG